MNIETVILGTFMKEHYLMDDSPITADWFENETNRRLFESMKTLRQQGQGIDAVTVMAYYDPREFGGASKILDIQDQANPEKIDDYTKALKDAYKEREKRNILSKARLEDWSLEKVQSELDKLTDDSLDDHSTMKELVIEVAEAPWMEQEEIRGVTTGLRELDAMTQGFQDGELVIVAARPSMGKSDVMLHLAKQAGWTGRLPVIFSLEMSDRSLRDRMIASVGGYNRMKMRNPNKGLNEEQKKFWPQALQRVMDTNVQIFDRAGQTTAEIRAKVRKLVNQTGLKPVVFVDYLTLIKPANPNSDNVHHNVGEISKDLKAIAKEFECPVVSLAQLSRKVEQRNDKRPMLSDLRESGSIEEDADVVVFLYRDSYYSMDDSDRSLEFIVAKQRNGPTGVALTLYNKHTGEIVDPR